MRGSDEWFWRVNDGSGLRFFHERDVHFFYRLSTGRASGGFLGTGACLSPAIEALFPESVIALAGYNVAIHVGFKTDATNVF
jgi:hypothetical protein